MTPYSPLMFRDRVQFYDLAKGVNTGGGKIKDYVPVGDPIACRVSRITTRIKEMGEYEATVTTYEVAFPGGPAVPPAEAQDQFGWLRPDGTELARLTVNSAPVPRDPDGRLWTADAVTVE